MISKENKRLSILVDNVLKSAVWDSSNLKLNLLTQPAHPFIEAVADSFKLQTENKRGQLKLELNAEDDSILMDK